MNENLNQEFWTQRYKDGDTGWDLGAPSPPIKKYIDELHNKELKILVPGAGNAYEVEYLWKQGFKNVFVLDISALPLESFARRNPDFATNQMRCMDFFDLEEKFDLVIEQTFFCAINRTYRTAYAKKMFEILNHQGKLVGLMFGKEFDKDGPPFGGTAAEYLPYFEPYFHIEKMEICQISIPPRAGNELWIELSKKPAD
jgi:SAM-dependent methyltransferase